MTAAKKNVDHNARHNPKFKIDESRLGTWSSRLAIAATAGCALLSSFPARAQDANQIQAEMRQLQQQIQGTRVQIERPCGA